MDGWMSGWMNRWMDGCKINLQDSLRLAKAQIQLVIKFFYTFAQDKHKVEILTSVQSYYYIKMLTLSSGDLVRGIRCP